MSGAALAKRHFDNWRRKIWESWNHLASNKTTFRLNVLLLTLNRTPIPQFMQDKCYL